jgi:hypothetical protein
MDQPESATLCDMFQHIPPTQMVLVAARGKMRAVLDPTDWRVVKLDVAMIPQAQADIRRRGYYVSPKWTEDEVRAALGGAC